MSTVFLEDETQSLVNKLAVTGGSRVDSYFKYAAADLWNNMSADLTTIFATVDTGDVFCRNQRLGAISQSCTAMPVDYDNVYLTFDWASNGTFSSFSDLRLSNQSSGVINAMQLLLAAVRLDIGNILPNNVFAYPDVLNATISANTELYQTLLSDKSILPFLGDASGSAVIVSEYLCHFPQRKPLGSLIITSSVFGSGWLVFFLLAMYHEKNKHRKGILAMEGNPRDCCLPECDSAKNGDIQKVADECLS
ncbi:hypothetical protein FRB95_005268 [Tulasnella sp. JGI-2019a]|nr:hypothetical protein FRB95_005268 [Tulasnella sp. JGI-2019a]